MPYTLITGPGAIVSISDVKARLKIYHDEDDTMIADNIAAAVATLDGRDGWLGRAILTQTWQFAGPVPSPVQIADFRFLAKWPASYIRLELPPVQSLIKIELLQSDVYVEQTLSNFALRNMKGYAVVRPIRGLDWPSMDDDEEAMRITFTTGEATCPAPVRAAILMLACDLYENPQSVVIDNGRATLVINPTMENLLKPYKVWAV